jgi:hypothetical protein
MYVMEIGWEYGSDFSGSEYDLVTGSCGNGNDEPSGSIKEGEFPG